MSPACARQAGMTLIEVLVAMCLLAILSVLGYKAFSALLLTRERLMETSTRWIALSRVFGQVGDEISTLPAGGGLRLEPDALRLASRRSDSAEIVYRSGNDGLSWSSGRNEDRRFPVLGAEYRVSWSVQLDDGRVVARWRPGDAGRPAALGMHVSGPLVGTASRLWSLP